MEYRFNLTPRLAVLGAFACVALLLLVFVLGFMLGLRMGEPDPEATGTVMPRAPLAAPAPEAEAP